MDQIRYWLSAQFIQWGIMLAPDAIVKYWLTYGMDVAIKGLSGLDEG